MVQWRRVCRLIYSPPLGWGTHAVNFSCRSKRQNWSSYSANISSPYMARGNGRYLSSTVECSRSSISTEYTPNASHYPLPSSFTWGTSPAGSESAIFCANMMYLSNLAWDHTDTNKTGGAGGGEGYTCFAFRCFSIINCVSSGEHCLVEMTRKTATNANEIP